MVAPSALRPLLYISILTVKTGTKKICKNNNPPKRDYADLHDHLEELDRRGLR